MGWSLTVSGGWSLLSGSWSFPVSGGWSLLSGSWSFPVSGGWSLNVSGGWLPWKSEPQSSPLSSYPGERVFGEELSHKVTQILETDEVRLHVCGSPIDHPQEGWHWVNSQLAGQVRIALYVNGGHAQTCTDMKLILDAYITDTAAGAVECVSLHTYACFSVCAHAGLHVSVHAYMYMNATASVFLYLRTTVCICKSERWLQGENWEEQVEGWLHGENWESTSTLKTFTVSISYSIRTKKKRKHKSICL